MNLKRSILPFLLLSSMLLFSVLFRTHYIFWGEISEENKQNLQAYWDSVFMKSSLYGDITEIVKVYHKTIKRNTIYSLENNGYFSFVEDRTEDSRKGQTIYINQDKKLAYIYQNKKWEKLEDMDIGPAPLVSFVRIGNSLSEIETVSKKGKMFVCQYKKILIYLFH